MSTDEHLRTVAEWRAVVDAVAPTGCPVVTIPVLALRMILDCCDPAWVATSQRGVRALAVPVGGSITEGQRLRARLAQRAAETTNDEAAPVAPGAAPYKTHNNSEGVTTP